MIILDQQELRRLVGILSGLQKISWSFKDKSTECGPRAFSLKIRWRENLKLNLHHSFWNFTRPLKPKRNSASPKPLDRLLKELLRRLSRVSRLTRPPIPIHRESLDHVSPSLTNELLDSISLEFLAILDCFTSPFAITLFSPHSTFSALPESSSPPRSPSTSQELLGYKRKSRPPNCGSILTNSDSPKKYSITNFHLTTSFHSTSCNRATQLHRHFTRPTELYSTSCTRPQPDSI